jgi:hypothetical protein
MIIVKTKNGDRFINDKAVTMVAHDRDKAVVNASGANGVYFHIEDVESIIYTNDAQPTSWKDEGSEIQRLKAVIEKKEKELSQMCEHFGYIREWFFIYQNAFDEIKDKTRQAERENKGIYVSPVAIIEQAEKKYEESQKRFEEKRAKWEVTN